MNRICVIGGTNIDICGTSCGPLVKRDSNPGMITVCFGGVGRNIAEVCALLGADVLFVTCFSADSYGTLLRADCQALGMDCSLSHVIRDVPSSMYLAVLDQDHDMAVAMNDMRLLKHLTPESVAAAVRQLDPSDWIILDANLEEECIIAALRNAPCPAAADPVSIAKAGRFASVLKDLAVFKPNRHEAEAMCGFRITGIESAREALDRYLEQGIREVIISMGPEGVLIGSAQRKLWLTHRRIDVKNATGGGDALLGSYICRRAKGDRIAAAAEFAVTAAVMAIEQDAVRLRILKEDTVLQKISQMEIRETEL